MARPDKTRLPLIWATAMALTGVLSTISGPSAAQGTDMLGPCLDPALAATHDDLIAAFRSEGWQDAGPRETDLGAWFKAATLSAPSKFGTHAAANAWKRDMRAWFDDNRYGYVILARDSIALVVKGLDAPLGRGPAHCMLIAEDLEAQAHESEPQTQLSPDVAAYLWSARDIEQPDTFELLELRFSTLELVEGERFEMLDLYMRPKE